MNSNNNINNTNNKKIHVDVKPPLNLEQDEKSNEDDFQTSITDEINNLQEDNGISEIINNLKTLSSEDSLANLFKDFTSGFTNNTTSNDTEQETNFENDESDNYDFEALNLDKYLLDDNGSNICNVLSKINDELKQINFNLNKMHNL